MLSQVKINKVRVIRERVSMLIRVLMDKPLGNALPIAFDVIKTSGGDGGDSHTRKGCVNLIYHGNAGRVNTRG